MALVISVKVIPNAKNSKLALDVTGVLCIYVTSQPEKGKANIEIVNLLSKLLAIPKRDIEIIAGITSKYKKFTLTNH